MPVLWLPEAELKALQAVFLTAAEVDWEAYERAKAYVLYPVPAPLDEMAESTEPG